MDKKSLLKKYFLRKHQIEGSVHSEDQEEEEVLVRDQDLLVEDVSGPLLEEDLEGDADFLQDVHHSVEDNVTGLVAHHLDVDEALPEE
jgi:hypothetical protein